MKLLTLVKYIPLTRIFEIHDQVSNKSITKKLKKHLKSYFIVTKTVSDPEIRDYAAMDNDIVDGLYNKMFLLEQVLIIRIFTGRSVLTQVSRLTSPTVSY